MRLRQIAIIICLVAPLIAQQRVDPRNRYERLWCVVPMVGKGTFDDPRRPQYAPLPGAAAVDPSVVNPNTVPAIIAFSFQVSDDGNYALVEFVARDRVAFKDILADTRPTVQAFVKGTATRGDIETAFKALKKDFDITTFGVPIL
jgi:hypothetical protein